MKQTINLGAFGWRHRHWLSTFYPEDLPIVDDGGDEDWRLAYYSNEFSAVLVPADYWQTAQAGDCEEWLDGVHADFRFFVQCRSDMFDCISLSELTAALTILAPQLSALVFLGKDQPLPEKIEKHFFQLAESLQIDIIDDVPGSRFAFIEDDLSDLRSARVMVERFAAKVTAQVADQIAGQAEGLVEDQKSEIVESIIIVNHPQLQAVNLSKFRAVLELMGY